MIARVYTQRDKAERRRFFQTLERHSNSNGRRARNDLARGPAARY